jgi:hypothetical protein
VRVIDRATEWHGSAQRRAFRADRRHYGRFAVVQRPPIKALYGLVALFVLLVVLALVLGGALAVLFWLAALAIVVYFGLVAVREFRGTPKR